MIKMGPFNAPLEPEDLLGKFVFKAELKNWLGLSEPRFVTEISYSRVYVSRLVSAGRNDDDVFLTADSIGISDGYIGITSVACICDTWEEANAVTRKLLEVRALDGTSGGDIARHVPAADLPLMARTKGPTNKINLSVSPWARNESEAA